MYIRNNVSFKMSQMVTDRLTEGFSTLQPSSIERYKDFLYIKIQLCSVAFY